jgi:hypothetical protein
MIGIILTILGIVLVITSIITLIVKYNTQETLSVNDLLKVSPLFFGGMFLAFFNMLFFYAGPGYSYLVQYPTGSQVVHTDPGYKLRMFGNLISIKKVISVIATHSNEEVSRSASKSMSPVSVRFNDAVTADIESAIRFLMPEDHVKFKAIALEFRSQNNLVNSLLTKHSREVTRNAARMYSAQQYISGRGCLF